MASFACEICTGSRPFAADRDDLVDGIPEGAVLAPDVADVAAPLGAHRRGEVQHFFRDE
jgi:hypothetical protein